jgi:hypothetical protein
MPDNITGHLVERRLAWQARFDTASTHHVRGELVNDVTSSILTTLILS